MTRYQLYEKVANALSKSKASELFNYIIHNMDDNGDFLRSRYSYSENVLPDSKLKGHPKFVLIAMEDKFDFNSEDLYNGKNTKLKMQLFYRALPRKIEDLVSLSSESGYEHIFKVNLKNGIIQKL